MYLWSVRQIGEIVVNWNLNLNIDLNDLNHKYLPFCWVKFTLWFGACVLFEFEIFVNRSKN